MRVTVPSAALLLLVAFMPGCRVDEALQPVPASRVSVSTRAPAEARSTAAEEGGTAPDETSRTQREVPAPVQKKEVLYIQPLGVDETPGFLEDMEFVKKALAAFYALDVRMLPWAALPKEAWYAPRKRYRAEQLLDYLDQVRPEGSRILGITTKDISTTKGRHEDWGILGLAALDGTVCVVSRFRAARRTEGGESDALTIQYRFAKTVVHELGHNFGLDHCPNKGCIMEDAKGTVITTDSEFTLCPTCRATIKRLFPAVAVENIEPPWPEPIAR